MSFEEDLKPESLKTKSPKTPKQQYLTLRQAIEYGEYDVGYLATFPEWHTLPSYVQMEYVNEAINNRRSKLLAHWAYINRTSDWSLRDDLKQASKKIEEQLNKIEKDRQRILVEYFKDNT